MKSDAVPDLGLFRHRGFGACCDPAVFHLPGVWQKIRQNVALYDVARALIGRKDIWVDLNR